jgi:hypothetical protein
LDLFAIWYKMGKFWGRLGIIIITRWLEIIIAE